MMEKFWYLVYVKENKEIKLSSWLTSKDIEYYLPVLKKVVNSFWGLRTAEQPLLTSRLFVKASEKDLKKIKRNANVINFVYWRNTPVALREETIVSLKKFVTRYINHEITINHIDVDPAWDHRPRLHYSESSVEIQLPRLGFSISALIENEEESTTVDSGTRIIFDKPSVLTKKDIINR